MTTRPIVDVKIDDSEFAAFKVKWDEYNLALKAMPGYWQEAGQEIDKHTSQFAKMFEKLERQDQVSKGALTEQTQFNRLLDVTEVTWVSLAKSGKSFATNIHTSTMQLARWVKLTTVFSGLLGAGGLFGIDRMAFGVAERRTSAGGLGVSIGEQSSFNVNLKRLGNSEGILQGFSAGLSHPVGRAQIGHLLGHAPTGNAAQTAAEALPKFKELVDSTDPAILDKMLEHLGYTKLGLGHEEAQLIKRMSRESVAEMVGQFKGDINKFGLTKNEERVWVDLNQTLKSAGQEIETVLLEGSKNLIGPIEDLSVSFVGLLDHLINGKNIPGWIRSVGKGLDDFGKSVGDESFQKSVSEYIKDAGNAAALVESMLAHSPSFAALIGIALAGRYLGGTAVRIGTGLAGLVGGTALAGAAGIAAVGAAEFEASRSTPLNVGEDERARQRRYGQGAPGSNAPAPNGSPSSSPSGHPAASQGGGATPRTFSRGSAATGAAEPGTPWNHEIAPGHANFMHGQYGSYGENQTSIEAGGRRVTVNKASAPHFKGFIDELAAEGAPIHGLGGLSIRHKVGARGMSQHSFGNAVDINQRSRNVVDADFQRWINNNPEKLNAAEKKWGMVGGEHWRNPDTGHWEWGGQGVSGMAGGQFAPKDRTLANYLYGKGKPESHNDRAKFGHPNIGHHPATIGKAETNVTIQNNAGSGVVVVPH